MRTLICIITLVLALSAQEVVLKSIDGSATLYTKESDTNVYVNNGISYTPTGKITVVFKEKPDYEAFAQTYGLTFVRSQGLSTYKGTYTIDDSGTVIEKINAIVGSDPENVLSITPDWKQNFTLR